MSENNTLKTCDPQFSWLFNQNWAKSDGLFRTQPSPWSIKMNLKICSERTFFLEWARKNNFIWNFRILNSLIFFIKNKNSKLSDPLLPNMVTIMSKDSNSGRVFSFLSLACNSNAVRLDTCVQMTLKSILWEYLFLVYFSLLLSYSSIVRNQPIRTFVRKRSLRVNCGNFINNEKLINQILIKHIVFKLIRA